MAVDPKEQKELKESWMTMKSRDIPLEIARGWGGGGFGFMPMAVGYCAPMPMMARSCPAPMLMCDSVAGMFLVDYLVKLVQPLPLSYINLEKIVS